MGTFTSEFFTCLTCMHTHFVQIIFIVCTDYKYKLKKFCISQTNGSLKSFVCVCVWWK